MSGHISGQIQFPQWLGRYSKQNKFDRILQELQVHTRLSAGLSKSSLNQDFIQHLRENITRPLRTLGQDGVSESVEAMEFYALMREDLDNLLEITAWPNFVDPMKSIESKVKAAFTRSYNKEVILPYAKTANVTKKVKVDTNPDGLDDEDEDDDNDDDNDDDIGKDAMIKAKKPSKAAPATKKNAKKATTAAEDKKGKGRGGKKSK
jgi:replication factor C subunit 1